MCRTIAYLDRYLSVRVVHPDQLQLLGCTCMGIAAKFEEIFPPPPQRIVDITAGACTLADVARSERDVLTTLAFRLATPTPKARTAATPCCGIARRTRSR